MAEFQTQDHRNKRRGIRSKKLSTRVDLTPMVDLGFLLITFFIFTTTMQRPNMVKLVLPEDKGDCSKVAESKTLSLILGPDNVIYYYNGREPGKRLQTNYAASGLRQVIRQKMTEVRQRFGKASETNILIKPTADCSYENVLAVLDEMLINDVQRYVLIDASAGEAAMAFPK